MHRVKGYSSSEQIGEGAKRLSNIQRLGRKKTPYHALKPEARAEFLANEDAQARERCFRNGKIYTLENKTGDRFEYETDTFVLRNKTDKWHNTRNWSASDVYYFPFHSYNFTNLSRAEQPK